MTIAKRLLQFITCILLLMAVAINRNGRILGREISAEVSETAVEEKDERVSEDGARIISTKRLAKDVYGFGGNVPLEICITSRRIESVKPLANSESPEFFNEVLASGLLEAWNGLSPEEALGKKVDAVAGATMSSTAVIESVRKGLAYAADTKVESKPDFLTDVRFWCVLAVVLAGMVLPFFFKDKRYRYVQLILNVLVLGFWSGSFLSLSAMVNLCSSGVVLNPAWLIVILMAVAAFIFPFFGKPGHYCAWICPLGSCQELIGKCIPYKIKISPKTLEILTTFREVLWVVILAVMLLGVGFEIMDYELFTAFLFRQAAWPLLIAALIVLALSGVVQRPYCRFICPTGTTIKFSAANQTNAKMNLSKILNLVLAICLVAALFMNKKGEAMHTTISATQAEQSEKTLFQQTRIGTLTLKNRFIRASMGDHAPDGKVNEKILDLYRTTARGGVGTILTGYTLVDGVEKGMGIMAMYDDSFIPGNKALVDTVHANGANILMQLVYIGANFHSPDKPARVLSASALQHPRSGVMTEAMTIEEIKAVEKKFAEAAVRAKTAGYDGVEIHACHGYLLNQFATPAMNERTDQYGGSRENRYRITLEVYDAIRKAVGEDYPVWIKVQSQDGYEDGVTNEDCLYLCQELAKRGIDAIEVSGDFFNHKGDTAYFRSIADKIARETQVPVIVTGGNRNYEEMERMIQETAIDYIGMARPFMSNPDLIHQFYQEYGRK